MDRILGFLPDADPTTPGALMVVDKMVPTMLGMAGQPSGIVPTGVGNLPGLCIGAAVVTKNDDTRRLFAATASTLYELVGTTWTSRNRVAPYTTGIDRRWAFAQFGDSTLASNLDDVIQRSPGAGAFADIATAPKARIIFSVGSFVMALNTSDGTYGVSPDRWWCCAANDETSWTPSVATLATTGRLVSSPGKITAGGALGEYAVAYKERAIYIAQFVGAPAVWDFQRVIGGDAGCVGQDAWCDIGGAHFVVGQEEMYFFDGTRPVPVGNGEVSDWFYRTSDPNQRHKIKCFYDKSTNLLHICYPSIGSTVCDSALCYHTKSKRWGHETLEVEALLNYVAPGATIDGLDATYPTIDSLSTVSFDSGFWLQGGRSFAHINTSGSLRSRTGAGPNVSCGFTTGDAGDDRLRSTMVEMRLRFEPGYKPSSATVSILCRDDLGDTPVTQATSTLADSKFDVIANGRWHSANVVFGPGAVRVTHLGATLIPEGDV
jgi:hypothetical protein